MKTRNLPLRSGASRAIKGVIASLGLVTSVATFAAPVGQLGVSVAGEEFGVGKEIHRDSEAKRIVESYGYTYRFSGKCESQPGTALGEFIGPKGMSLDAFVEALKEGSADLLGDDVDNAKGTYPVTLINETITGTKTLPKIGKVKISLTILGRIDEDGKCFVDVTDVTFKTKPKLTPKQRKALGTIEFKRGSKMLISALPTVLFKRGNTAVDENVPGGKLTVTAWRATNYHGRVSVNYTTEDGTANSTHYTGQSGTLVFEDGDADQDITIDIKDNGIKDGPRSFKIKLIDPVEGAAFASPTEIETTVTIKDDD